MIFVTVGTHTQGFERLVRAVDELKGSGKIKEKVVMQIGNTKYAPKNCDSFRFESFKKILELNKSARVIITHAGAGCILTALRFKKPLIIMPRRKMFGEHTDDHQRGLAEALDSEKMAIRINGGNEIEAALESVKKLRQKRKKSALAENLKKYLEKEN